MVNNKNAKKGSVTTQIVLTQQMYRDLKKEAAGCGMSYSSYVKHLILIARSTAA